MSRWPSSIATTFVWNAVGVCASSRVTCITGQTSRQNLCPELKQLYAAFRHFAANSDTRAFTRATLNRAAIQMSGHGETALEEARDRTLGRVPRLRRLRLGRVPAAR